MWGRRTKISDDMDLTAAPHTTAPSDHVAPKDNGVDGWWAVGIRDEVFDELNLVVKHDADVLDITAHFYVPDFDRGGDPEAGSVIPGRVEADIPKTSAPTATKGGVYRIPVPFAATHVSVSAAVTGGTYVTGALYAGEEV